MHPWVWLKSSVSVSCYLMFATSGSWYADTTSLTKSWSSSSVIVLVVADSDSFKRLSIFIWDRLLRFVFLLVSLLHIRGLMLIFTTCFMLLLALLVSELTTFNIAHVQEVTDISFRFSSEVLYCCFDLMYDLTSCRPLLFFFIFLFSVTRQIISMRLQVLSTTF